MSKASVTMLPMRKSVPGRCFLTTNCPMPGNKKAEQSVALTERFINNPLFVSGEVADTVSMAVLSLVGKKSKFK